MGYLRSIVVASVALLAQQALEACNKENLLNAFIRTVDLAASFCSTYTQGLDSPLPTFVPTNYGTSRYSSACICIATTSSSPATTLAITTSSPSVILSATSCTPVTITASASTVTLSASTVSIIVTVTQTVTSTSRTSSTISTTSSAAACLETSVITNGGFEASSNSILPWTLTGASPLYETYMSHGGTYNIMAYHGSGSPAYTLNQTVSVCPDTPYITFRAHTDGDTAVNPCLLQVCFNGDCLVSATISNTDITWAKYSRVYDGGDASAFQVSITTAACGLFCMMTLQ